VSYRTKLKECEQALQHFKTDVYSSMKTQHDTQLKLEKLTGQLQEVEAELSTELWALVLRARRIPRPRPT